MPNVTARQRTRHVGAIAKTTTEKRMGAVVARKDHMDQIPVDDELGQHAAYVMVKGGVTRNMGDYNSITVQVSIGMPCQPTLEAVEIMYGTISEKVDELVDRELNAAIKGDGQ